jgi:DNA repair protein RadD
MSAATMSDMFHTAAPRELRPHQAETITKLRSSLAQGNKRVVCMAPTGFGKTMTAAKIIESALAKNRKVLFTVPRLSLVDQTVVEFMREGITDIGVIQANHPRTNPLAKVQVASVQTLAKRKVPDDFGLVLVDECHETFAIIYELMKRWPKTHFVGLSATPWAKGMGCYWDDLVIAATIGSLIDMGFLSKFVAYAPDIPDLTGVKTVAGDYAENGLADVMADKKLVAHVVETWLEKGENRPTLLFGVNCAHAKNLQQKFIDAGISAGYCDAYTDSVERAILARRFKSGEIRVACSVRTLTTGIDWPVSCIIDAAPTQSEMLHVQKIGRGLRINPGTEDLIILDHAGNSLRLGLVTDIYHDKLDKRVKGEKDSPKEKLPKLPTECANCGTLQSGLICPCCGREIKPTGGVETVEGELKAIGGKAKIATMSDKQVWWSAILSVKAERGKSSGWAAHCYRDKFMVWPRGLVDVPGPVSAEVRNFIRAKAIRFAKSQEKAVNLVP